MLSSAYKEQLQELHSGSNWGNSAHRWVHEVRRVAKGLRVQSVLDYGAGKGSLKDSLREFPLTVTEYDPGVPGKESPPEPAELVACLDVLEHIEPEHLDSVLDDIYRLAERGALCVIALYEGRRRLPDGRPAHLIVESQEWWEARIRSRWPAGAMGFETRQVPGRRLTARVRECLVVTLEKNK